MWEEPTTSLYEGRPRLSVPDLPAVGDNIQVVTSRKEHQKFALAYLAVVVRETDDKMVVMRALASAVSILFGDASNFTGSPLRPVVLEGLDIFTDDAASDTAHITSNFEGAPDLALADVDPYADCDIDELGAFFGNMFHAGTKKLTPQNATSFNDKRLNTVLSTTLVPLKIFVPGSTFLDERILNKVYASFTSMAALRCQMIYKTSLKMGSIRYGPSVAFTAFFMLLTDSGLGTLRVIKEASLKCGWLREDFPELRPELEAADRAQQALRSIDAPFRPFAKAVFGSAWVPLPQSEASNLLGVSRSIMSHFVPSYKNFGGGYTTPRQDAIIADRLGVRGTTTTAETI
jgi:hypothetical protein